ncbi:MAG TPA: helix-turn-helix domain-containing protein [Nitrososphaeraceae archaeon]|nr:helix-turn-helix domain-containing protein [Nitrososphaeraceae archaeon]
MTQNLKFCPIHNTFNLIGRKFTILILRDMMLYGKKRFNELRESVEDINSKTLTLRLREMELDGLIVRRVYPETPVRIEYELTEKAKNLRPILEQLGEYSTRFCASNIFKDKRPRRFKDVLEEISVSNL